MKTQEQLELPLEARIMSEIEILTLFNMQQKEIDELSRKLDELQATINKMLGVR